MGAGFKDIGETGGGTSGGTALQISQLPSHDHQVQLSGETNLDGKHTHGVTGGGNHTHTGTTDGDGVHSHSMPSGGGHTHTVSPVVRNNTNIIVGSSGQNAKGAEAPGSLGLTGGAHTHSINQTSAHTHTFTTAGADHSHGTTEQRDHTHTVSLSGSTHGAGSGITHTHPDIVPKYYTLAYIMKEYL
jgi:hypothetical protein